MKPLSVCELKQPEAAAQMAPWQHSVKRCSAEAHGKVLCCLSSHSLCPETPQHIKASENHEQRKLLNSCVRSLQNLGLCHCEPVQMTSGCFNPFAPTPTHQKLSKVLVRGALVPDGPLPSFPRGSAVLAGAGLEREGDVVTRISSSCSGWLCFCSESLLFCVPASVLAWS